jgi:hypothetical protein
MIRKSRAAFLGFLSEKPLNALFLLLAELGWRALKCNALT